MGLFGEAVNQIITCMWYRQLRIIYENENDLEKVLQWGWREGRDHWACQGSQAVLPVPLLSVGATCR